MRKSDNGSFFMKVSAEGSLEHEQMMLHQDVNQANLFSREPHPASNAARQRCTDRRVISFNPFPHVMEEGAVFRLPDEKLRETYFLRQGAHQGPRAVGMPMGVGVLGFNGPHKSFNRLVLNGTKLGGKIVVLQCECGLGSEEGAQRICLGTKMSLARFGDKQ
jgi:hypothetical protein